MKKYVAVEGCVLTLAYNDPSVGGGTSTINSLPSAKVVCDRKRVYSGTLTGAINGVTGAPDFVQSIPTSFSINPTTVKTTAEGKFVVREEDTGTFSVRLTSPDLGSKTVTGTVKVSVAGQQKVRAN